MPAGVIGSLLHLDVDGLGCRSRVRKACVRHDGDGAGGVIQDGVADGAEKETGEAAESATADND
jgi:hypothetical protein